MAKTSPTEQHEPKCPIEPLAWVGCRAGDEMLEITCELYLTTRLFLGDSFTSCGVAELVMSAINAIVKGTCILPAAPL